MRYEATVGAGLPVIDTFRKLVESGDRVLRVEGCVSGTLGFVLSSLEAGATFSGAVREAVARGYAEPDPREDLSGADALRKGLILARLIGYSGMARHAESLRHAAEVSRRRRPRRSSSAPSRPRRRLWSRSSRRRLRPSLNLASWPTPRHRLLLCPKTAPPNKAASEMRIRLETGRGRTKAPAVGGTECSASATA